MNMRNIRKLTCCILALSFLTVINVQAKSTDWGLGFEKDGQQPTGPVTADFLKQYDSYFIGKPDEKIIYLTFDAGYENSYTSNILDTLQKHEVPAAFFLLGGYIKNNPELIKRMSEEGHIVANHTMTHPDMSKISDKEAFAKELTLVEDIYKEVTGTDIPKFYRPPKGVYSESNLKHAQELGYKTFFWSLAYRDWEDDNQPSKEQAFARMIPRIHPGAVILLHNTSKTNSLILDELIAKYKELGYRFESLHHLANLGESGDKADDKADKIEVEDEEVNPIH